MQTIMTQSLRFSIEPIVRIFRVFSFGRVDVLKTTFSQDFQKTKLVVRIFKRFRVVFS